MSEVQGDQVHNNLELKNIFNLLNPNSDGEIEIKQINNLIQQLDTLKINFKNNKGVSGSDENNDQSPGISQHIANLNGDSKNDKKQNANQQKSQNFQQQNSKASNSEQNQKLISQNSVQGNSQQQKTQSSIQAQEKEFLEVVELRYFPNNKTTINFNEFCAYFNECISNKELQEELLHGCFNQFDFNEEACINSKKIKSIFEVFNDKTNQEEIQNVLKFCGVSNDKMSYEEFKQFFEKNL
ncbi:hypothetical protein ABPG74_006388 [Tetrahymena malaccensis]